ncbi:MAG: hypothetical protein IJ155_08810 [Prevotella sp.]|nr:hypothetical protein [Prevotella sp.]
MIRVTFVFRQQTVCVSVFAYPSVPVVPPILCAAEVCDGCRTTVRRPSHGLTAAATHLSSA